jgi:AcrR family transcriptional regulator
LYKRCTTEKAALQQRKLEECLLSVMQDKPYSEISVSSLCEQTDLSRKTFYRLFESKQDVLDSLIDRTLREYIRYPLPQSVDTAEVSPDLLGFYCFWLDQRKLLDALSKNGMSTMLYDRSIRHMLQEETDILRQLGVVPSLPENTEALMFFLSGILTLVVGWHHTGYQKSPLQMAAITEKLLSQPPVRFIEK